MIPLINSTQPIAGSYFEGSAVTAHPVGPQTVIQPAAALLHQTGGNQGFQDFPGPLGKHIRAPGYATPIYTAWWSTNGDLTVATVVQQNGTAVLGICALDPEALQQQSCWTPDDASEQLNFAYSELVLETNNILLNSPQGNLYVVHRNQDCATPTFKTIRKISFADQGVFQKDETLKNGLFDTDGNIWFTSGSFTGNIGDAPQNTTTIGYIEPDDTIHRIHLANQVIENSIAVSNTTMFIQTGPAGANDHANAKGQIYAFQTGQKGDTSSVKTLWNQKYDAGSGFKPGGFGRGSGTSVSLLGNEFVALVDHADVQASLQVYHQISGQHVCSVPVFSPNASAVDNGLLNAFDDTAYGIIALNDYNVSKLFVAGDDDIDGPWNNMTGQSPGVVRIDVVPKGDGTAECRTKWDLPLRVKSVATISTGSGLVYAYVQDEKLALKGEYVWYVVAMDFATGKEVWRVRTGSGGSFNDNFQASTLSPDGRFIQGVQGGIVVAMDGGY